MSHAATVTARTALTLPDGRYLVEQNLYLVVRRGGASRSYILRYTIHGIRRDLSLGDPRSKPLVVARNEAARARLMVAQGMDPKAVREEARAAAAKGPCVVFSAYLPSALEELAKVRQWKARTCIRNSYLAKHLLSADFADKPLDEIGSRDVLRFLSPRWTTSDGASDRALLEMIFALARSNGVIETPNPAVWKGNLDAFLTPVMKAHRKVNHYAVSVEELRAGIATAFRTKNPYAHVIAALALTACRRDEVRLARRAEIDLDAGIFTVPPERRKDQRPEPHRVPLSEQARRIFAEWPEECASPVSKGGLLHAFKRVTGNSLATLHGVRSTFRDWCAETGQDPILAEKSLMHATGTAVQQAYQRSDLLEQRRPLMQEWADAIMPLECGDIVQEDYEDLVAEVKAAD